MSAGDAPGAGGAGAGVGAGAGAGSGAGAGAAAAGALDPDGLRALMERAFALADRCPDSDTAWSVGALLADRSGRVLAEGWSRQPGPAWHAEEAALDAWERGRERAAAAGAGGGAGEAEGGAEAEAPWLCVCTLEPCFFRQSRPLGCSTRLIQAGVRWVAYAEEEDGTLLPEGTRQRGREALLEAGVGVIQLHGWTERFRAQNRHLG